VQQLKDLMTRTKRWECVEDDGQRKYLWERERGRWAVTKPNNNTYVSF